MDLSTISPDFVIVLLFIIMLAIGYFKGGLSDIRTIVSLVLGTIAVPIFYPAARNVLTGIGICSDPRLGAVTNMAAFTVAKISAFVIIAVITNIILTLTFPVQKTNVGKAFNGFLGMGTAFIKTVFIVWLINWTLSLANWKLFNDTSYWLNRSPLYRSLSSINILEILQQIK